jgi:endonuclease-3
MMNLATREEVFRRFKAANPHPEGELDYTNTYTFLVAVALSAQSTDVGVNKATKSLFAKVSTPQEMLDLGHDALIDHVKSIGLYKTKAKNVIAAADMLVKLHDGIVPNDQEALEALPGVGRKTVNVVRNIAFGEPTVAVDTHILRIANRTGLCKAKTPDQMMDKLPKKIPDEYVQDSHHWLILHGRYVCKARKPECNGCIIYDLCEFKEKTA